MSELSLRNLATSEEQFIFRCNSEESRIVGRICSGKLGLELVKHLVEEADKLILADLASPLAAGGGLDTLQADEVVQELRALFFSETFSGFLYLMLIPSVMLGRICGFMLICFIVCMATSALCIPYCSLLSNIITYTLYFIS